MDNVIAAEETIFNLQKHNIPGNAVKVNFAKAFDMVDWDFLLDLLVTRGFWQRWIHWIIIILHSFKAYILINGSPNGYVHYQRGLRQDDPFLPSYLF